MQENILLDLDKVTQNIGQYPLHHVTCAPAGPGHTKHRPVPCT